MKQKRGWGVESLQTRFPSLLFHTHTHLETTHHQAFPVPSPSNPSPFFSFEQELPSLLLLFFLFARDLLSPRSSTLPQCFSHSAVQLQPQPGPGPGHLSREGREEKAEEGGAPSLPPSQPRSQAQSARHMPCRALHSKKSCQLASEFHHCPPHPGQPSTWLGGVEIHREGQGNGFGVLPFAHNDQKGIILSFPHPPPKDFHHGVHWGGGKSAAYWPQNSPLASVHACGRVLHFFPVL